jgi:hypothetical protein
MTTIKPSIEVVLRKEASQGSNNKKKYVAGFGLGNRLAEGSGSCFKDQVEWCLGSPTEF